MPSDNCPVCGKHVKPMDTTLWWGRYWHHACAQELDPGKAKSLADTAP